MLLVSKKLLGAWLLLLVRLVLDQRDQFGRVAGDLIPCLAVVGRCFQIFQVRGLHVELALVVDQDRVGLVVRTPNEVAAFVLVVDLLPIRSAFDAAGVVPPKDHLRGRALHDLTESGRHSLR